tara:strand:- start:195 stop:1079 length:885 start_codon:yes stop_codon:yes gene_type:complete
MMGLAMTSITLDTLASSCLNIERTGHGPPILALHGFSGNLSSWDSFSEAAQSEFSLITLDILGHGNSDSPNNPELYGMENTVKALGELLDKLDISHVHWLGYSMGGRIALAAGILLNKRTLSVTLESSSPGFATPEERETRIISDESLADKIEAEGIPAFVDYWEALPLWASQVRLPDTVKQKLRLQRLKNNPVGLANSLRSIGTGAQPSFHDRLGQLQAPALFIAGEEDEKFVDISQQMHGVLTNSQLIIVKESGHTVHLEQPDTFNRTVLGFLRAVNDSNIPEVQTGSQPNR